MRIALVCSSFLPRIGGAEFVVHHLACQWAKQGHEVWVMNNVTDEATHAEGCYTVKRFNLLRGSERIGYHRFPFNGYAIHGLRRLLDMFQPEFISAHFAYPVGVWLSRLKPMPRFLVTCHGADLTTNAWGYRMRYRIDRILVDAMNRSAGAVAISTHVRRVMEEMGVEPSRILDIPNGVDLEKFGSKVDFDFRGKLGLPGNAFVILSVGRDHAAKAYDTGIRAFAELANKVPDVRYVIVGSGTPTWQPLVDELGLTSRVVLCSGLFGDELIGAYQQADVFFSPSVVETFPLVVVEAMAAGLPAVVTNVSGSQDMIQNGSNGLVVGPNQVGEMAHALFQMITDESMRTRMRLANLAKSRGYGWDRISRLYLQHA